MNSRPHLGTTMSLMTAFALGSHLSEDYKIPAKLNFNVLENAPTEQKVINGITYTKMYHDIYRGGTPVSELYLNSFIGLLDSLQAKSNVGYELLPYKQFQEIPFVRKTLLEILDRQAEFTPLLAPSDRKLHIRFPCPDCKYMEKQGIKTAIKERAEKYDVTLESECFEHGKHQIRITPNNKDFVDMNTPVRTVAREALFIEDSKKRNALNLVVMGGDLIHLDELVVSEGLSLLGYNYKDRPTRVYAPLVEDWSGAKLSKSVYVRSGTYGYLPSGFLDIDDFKVQFGNEGVDKLWKEAKAWVTDPKKLFRNYSVDYFVQLLRTS